MVSRSKRPLRKPPWNPGVQQLIQGKRESGKPMDFENLKRGFRGWQERGYLPHRDEPGLIQFVTFRLVDAFPAELRSEWKAILEIETERERRRELEAYLDKGRGDCYLRRPEVAQIVEDSLRFFHR